MKLISDTIIQKWRDADGANDTLIAETAFDAIGKRPAITTRDFVTALRNCCIRGNTTLLNYALGQAKVEGSNIAGVAAQVATKRAEIAQKQLEKQREAAAKKAKKDAEKAELEALKEKAATNEELAVELVKRNLTQENENLIALEREQMRITLLVNKSRRVLENAGNNLCPPILNWTPSGMVDLAECREVAALAKPEVEAWLFNGLLRKGKLEASGKDAREAKEFVDKCEKWLETIEQNRASNAIANK